MLASSSLCSPTISQLLRVPGTSFTVERTEMSRQEQAGEDRMCCGGMCILELRVVGTEKGSLNGAWRDEEGFLMER